MMLRELTLETGADSLYDYRRARMSTLFVCVACEIATLTKSYCLCPAVETEGAVAGATVGGCGGFWG